MPMKFLIVATSLVLTLSPAFAADVVKHSATTSDQRQLTSAGEVPPVFEGRVAILDGRTLWFPAYAQRVRLADIDTCELPQWALDPKWTSRALAKAPPPVPCGPFAKAWLKKTVASAVVSCAIVGYDQDSIARARCMARGHDLALEMLRVGWARVQSPYPADPQYGEYQRAALSSRYGMWATYVLDMNEWRRKAVDKTLNRHPNADKNLLVERESEISPPFSDARRKPQRTDR